MFFSESKIEHSVRIPLSPPVCLHYFSLCLQVSVSKKIHRHGLPAELVFASLARMKLRRVQVQNYRSIVDSGVVDIEERVTVIIGKNEQGKTNFLKGIVSFNRELRYQPNDLPNHLRPSLETQEPEKVPIITLWLNFDGTDKVQLKEIIKEIEELAELKVTRYYGGNFSYAGIKSTGEETLVEFTAPDLQPFVENLLREAESLKEKLRAHARRFPTFAVPLPQAEQHIDAFKSANFSDTTQIENLIKTFSTALKGLPAQDKPIQDDISAVLTRISGAHAGMHEVLRNQNVNVLHFQFPRFLFHSTSVDRMPNEVKIADYIQDPEKASKGMANLCSVAGLSVQKIQELANSADTPHREAYEDHFRSSISGAINEYWTQEKYHVHFRIEKEKLSVSISDDTYGSRIPPMERSDGFQWYLSFYCALLNEATGTQPTVLLLDNPGLELHADGQRDIKRFLEEKIPLSTQVVYITHSSAMVDPYNIAQVRCVEIHGNQRGTKVSNSAFKDGKDLDLLEPVRSALGAKLVSSLIFNDYNVLVEGAADKPILEGAFFVAYKEAAKKILVNGSISESAECFLPRFYQRSGLPFAIYLDADSSGRNLMKQLKGHEIPEEKIIDLKSCVGKERGEDFELEDILNVDFYHYAVLNTYPSQPVDKPATSTGKRTKAYEKEFDAKHQIGFNKRRVAETVKRLLIDGKCDEESLMNLGKVTSAIHKALENQTKPIKKN